MTAIHELTAHELVAAYATRELSPVEVTQAAFARLDAWEPAINAMYRVAREAALAQARAAEARWRRGEPKSALDGVPITIKENIATAGDPAPIGTRANEEAPAQPVDGPPAARVREAGCVILGKTTMPDFGMLVSGQSSLHGVTRNPWQLDRNPGGSSSGAGAAAVAGYAPLHLGTDIGGSVRLPAAYAGIFALKPSLGRVPVYPPFMGRVTGPMTRTVRDAALLMNTLARPDARDFMSLPPHDHDFSHGLDALDVRPLKIGLLADLKVGLPVDDEVAAAVRAAAHALAGAGAIIEDVPAFVTPDMLDGMGRFFEARAHNDFMAMSPERQRKVLPFIAEWCMWRAPSFTGRDVIQAYNQVMTLRDATVAACQPFDFVISPVSPILPFSADLPAPGNDPHNALPHIAFTVPFNMSEQPAASINWTASRDGMPIGIQLIGRRFDDAGVLKLARLVEQLRPAQRAWPELGS
jgi:aspartyl-tRNA(Asn)/glutamyl-tRNA(Gln) amidotransferase subunit A